MSTQEKAYRVKINLYLHGVLRRTWRTERFDTDEDIERLKEVLNTLGDLKSVFFSINDGTRLYLSSGMIDQCTFELEEFNR